MNTSIFKKAGELCSRGAFAVRNHSPEILLVVGVIGTIASTVLACKATIKAQDILEEAKEKLDKIHTCESDEKLREQYSEEDSRKDKTTIYIQTGVKLAKLYAPSVLLGAASIGSMVTSNVILKKRGAALLAAYTAVDTSFKEYRSRVAEKLGEEAEKQIRYGIEEQTVSEKIVDENGEEFSFEEKVAVPNMKNYSRYARIFDESNINYEKDSDYNKTFLTLQQNYLNDRLRAKGHVFLNEVYDALGFERTKAGQIVGWTYRPNDSLHEGDNYIDFGMYDLGREKARDFVNGYERAIILDFNVDGPIIDTF